MIYIKLILIVSMPALVQLPISKRAIKAQSYAMPFRII